MSDGFLSVPPLVSGGAFNGAQRAMLVSAFRTRRGGTVGTSGKPVVALRFDHGVVDFKAKVLPLLKEYSLPWSLAINPSTIGDASNDTTFAELQTLCIDNGGEVWNHGRTHLDAVGRGPIRTEIETSLTDLQTGLSGLAIEGWAPPGLAVGGFGGYAPMNTPEQHWDTFAGQLVLSNHAAVAGYLAGIYRTLPANLEVGAGQPTMDAQTAATVNGWVNGAITAKAGIQLMLHPVYLDGSGYMTTADLEAVFANIAAQRDAGAVEVLTPSALLLADPGSTARNDQILNGSFGGTFTSWANTTDWSVVTSGGLTYATTTTGTPITQALGFIRKEKLLGGARELVYKVRATAGAVVRTGAAGPGVAATKDVALTAYANWVEVRQPVVVPLNFTGNLTLSVGRVSGGAVDITDIRLQAI